MLASKFRQSLKIGNYDWKPKPGQLSSSVQATLSHPNCRLLGQSWKKTSTCSFAVLTASGQSHENKVDWPAACLLFLVQNAETALCTLFDAHQKIHILLYSLKRCWKNISLHFGATLNCLLSAVSWKFVYCFASIIHWLAEVRIQGLLFGV